MTDNDYTWICIKAIALPFIHPATWFLILISIFESFSTASVRRFGGVNHRLAHAALRTQSGPHWPHHSLLGWLLPHGIHFLRSKQGPVVRRSYSHRTRERRCHSRITNLRKSQFQFNYSIEKRAIFNLKSNVYWQISECSSSSIRGTLGSLTATALAFGILVTYIIGAFVPWHVLAGILSTFPLLMTTAMIFQPETPVWLMSHGRPQDARNSLAKLRGK